MIANHRTTNYNARLSGDYESFIYTAYFQSDKDQKLLNELPSFKSFQEQLKSGGCEFLPKQELLSLFGSSNNILNA